MEAGVGEAGLWGLFNNAGISVAGPLEHLPIDDLRRQREVNVIGQVAVTQAFLPLLCTARGRIFTTGSIAGYFAAPALAPYSISKFAIAAFSDALRRELRPCGIEVRARARRDRHRHLGKGNVGVRRDHAQPPARAARGLRGPGRGAAQGCAGLGRRRLAGGGRLP